MRQAEVVIGGTYLARVSGRIVVVQVKSERRVQGYKQKASRRYDVVNLMTKRELQMGAGRLRDRAEKNPETGKWRRATTPDPVPFKRGAPDAFTLGTMPRPNGVKVAPVACRYCFGPYHLELIEEHERTCYRNPNRVSDAGV